MTSQRLQQQFIRLWKSCQGESRDTPLSKLALQLNCSRHHHVRSLLKNMQHVGWLSWHSQAGRGKRSRLDFHYTGLGLQQQRASELLEQDRIDQLDSWWERSREPADDAAFSPGPRFPPGQSYPAGALLSPAEQFAARYTAAAFRQPYRSANFQRPNAHK